MQGFHQVPRSDGGSCDFCTAQPIRKFYSCRNFKWHAQNVFPGGSAGAWAACAECAELVDAERWAVLTERSLREFLINHSITQGDVTRLREQFRLIHELFRQYRIPETQACGLSQTD